VNTQCNAIRKVVLTQTWLKPVETFAFCVITATCFFFATYMTYTEGWCLPKTVEANSGDDYQYFRGWCTSDMYDPMASILWATEGGIIRNIMSDKI